ncbi:perforin-1-like [Scleropages formosus]|uniref:Perforin-1-like n=1 Tax=Scleropages formosus TaxID=113540 RepID=A0A0P7TJY9_SCLFO|nr:perforin-1-like [Scleropages formosus]
MERLWKIFLLAWMFPVQCLPGKFGTMFHGTPEQCEKAGLVPGSNLGGEGFDIVKMERKGAYVIDTEKWKNANGTCNLVRNSYLGGIQQKLPLVVVDWRALSKCVMKVSSSIYDSSEAVAKDSTSSVSNNWKIGLNLPVQPNVNVGVGFGGTHAQESTYAMKKSKEDKYTFAKHKVDCSFYRYRVTSKPLLHPEFLISIDRLSGTKADYINLVDTYGTHFINEVTLGGKLKTITSIQSCQVAMSGLTDTAVKDCLDVEASATLSMTAEIKTEFHHCKELKKKFLNNAKFSSMFSDRHYEMVGGIINTADLLFAGGSDPNAYKEWLTSLKTVPNVVLYSLKPLHQLLPPKHPAVGGVKKAVEDYIMQNALLKRCAESCNIGTRSSVRDPCACVCQSNRNINYKCCPTARGLATLEVYGMRAQGLYGDVWTQTDGSVQVSYGSQVMRTAVIQNNDNPIWPERFEFGSIRIDEETKLTFEVYDEDNVWNSELLGTCSFQIQQGKESKSCMFSYGTFFFSYKVTCGPSLGGHKCRDYIASPMSATQANIFQSRNGILAKNLWKLQQAGNHSKASNHQFFL